MFVVKLYITSKVCVSQKKQIYASRDRFKLEWETKYKKFCNNRTITTFAYITTYFEVKMSYIVLFTTRTFYINTDITTIMGEVMVQKTNIQNEISSFYINVWRPHSYLKIDGTLLVFPSNKWVEQLIEDILYCLEFKKELDSNSFYSPYST